MRRPKEAITRYSFGIKSIHPALVRPTRSKRLKRMNIYGMKSVGGNSEQEVSILTLMDGKRARVTAKTVNTLKASFLIYTTFRISGQSAGTAHQAEHALYRCCRFPKRLLPVAGSPFVDTRAMNCERQGSTMRFMPGAQNHDMSGRLLPRPVSS